MKVSRRGMFGLLGSVPAVVAAPFAAANITAAAPAAIEPHEPYHHLTCVRFGSRTDLPRMGPNAPVAEWPDDVFESITRVLDARARRGRIPLDWATSARVLTDCGVDHVFGEAWFRVTLEWPE